MQKFLVLLGIFLTLLNCGKTYQFSGVQELDNIILSGARSSAYGVRPFPSPEVWSEGIGEINQKFNNSTPSALWIVGVMGKESKYCHLEFPVEKGKYKNITSMDFDKHEKYLSHFDSIGVKVYLQVESAMADVDILIKLILDRYSHHPCVIGFGVDAEWHRYSKENDWGVPIDDESAERWEALMKSYNSKYQLFLKHWDRRWMPKKYRGDIIFVSDSQMFKNKNQMLKEFNDYWGKYFYPNTVFYQIGYPADKKLWNSLEDPIKEWGISLANNHKQKVGIYWVDFTLKDAVKNFKDDGDYIIGTKIYNHDGDLNELFEQFKSARINTLVSSKELNAKPEFCQLAKENNMKRFLIFPTFYAPEYLKENPQAYAIQKNGEIAKEEWVEFACPSNDEFRQLRINQLKKMVEEYDLDGISIDFIRHFAFWEKIYSDADDLPNTCFCKNCMTKFENHIDKKIEVETPAEYYNWIMENDKVEWVRWKCELITSMVRDLVEAAKEINPELLVNIHVVPWRTTDFDNAIEVVAGQDLNELAKVADYLSPMTYAHMLKQDPEWISSVVKEMSVKTNCKIIPSFQVSKCYLEEEISLDTFRQYFRKSREYPSSGFVYWSWERLNDEQKNIIMRK